MRRKTRVSLYNKNNSKSRVLPKVKVIHHTLNIDYYLSLLFGLFYWPCQSFFDIFVGFLQEKTRSRTRSSRTRRVELAWSAGGREPFPAVWASSNLPVAEAQDFLCKDCWTECLQKLLVGNGMPMNGPYRLKKEWRMCVLLLTMQRNKSCAWNTLNHSLLSSICSCRDSSQSQGCMGQNQMGTCSGRITR